MKIKTYRLYGMFLPQVVLDAVGVPPRVRQADVLIAATSKAEAFRMATARKIPTTLRDTNFRLAGGGRTIDTLRLHNMLDEPGVFAVPDRVAANHYMVSIAADGRPTRVCSFLNIEGQLTLIPTKGQR